MPDLDNPGSQHKFNRDDLIAAARKLWGRETSTTRKELRFGSKGSKSIDLENLVWFDHEADTGGGIVDLCQSAGINGEWRAQEQPARRKTEWVPIVPPPDDAPTAPIQKLSCDKLFSYRGADGETLFHVRRFEAPRKFWPLTYGALDGATGWHPRAPAPPIPLYNLDLLHALDKSVVVLCEGEKAADAANNALATTGANMIALSWFGGAARAKHADLLPLKDRKVIIWPDADEAGAKAGAELMEKLPQAQIINTTGLPDGFDAADLREPIGPWLEARLSTSREQKAEPAADEGERPQPVVKEDLYAVMAQGTYVFPVTGDTYPAAMIDKRLGKKTSTWIAKNQPVEQMTWAPGEPTLIHDKLIREGGWIEREEARVLNLYRAPPAGGGNPAAATPWLDYIKRIYPDDWEHIIAWCAQRVQFPHIKINHALVIGGAMGIGKDNMLEPVKRAVGAWNFIEVSPQHMLDKFNGYAKSVILRVNEARDLGDSDRFKFYDHMKAVTAAPPDTILVNEKHLKPYSIPNLTGVIITTNYKADGIHLPADDRRHYVAWSQITVSPSDSIIHNELWHWYSTGGFEHAAAYLRTFDLEGFDPKAPPPKTPAFWDIASAARAPEDAGLADAIDKLSKMNEDAFTLDRLKVYASGETLEWLNDRKNRRAIPHRLEKVGYVQVRNLNRADHYWLVDDKRSPIYASATLSNNEQIAAAEEIVRRGG